MQAPNITTVKTAADVRGILALQQKNLKKNLTAEQIESQGFVTVEHNFDVLKNMNNAQPSVIAKDGDTVVGYCLAMLPQFRYDVPEIRSLFDTIDLLTFENRPLKEFNYVVMGQVCVGKGYRSMGLFDGMYQKLREELSDKFDMCITDISSRNLRSQKAHTRIGFQNIKDFHDTELNEIWRVVLWDWRS
ncbi:GNAT family N-acetyltransferase [Emticicia sp. TH156]|uniref:GNAT family N-acetyltransferase n=1 Tax=Emticicia sp. TH156 TaxID=2067454 RepID=UPI000C76EF3F|nr:GNAT family N-acetyltransferase [Emticicia sp. TH156]PLK46482.1 GNAT family N-acetyltransferase [Emticicia sp. TH156]